MEYILLDLDGTITDSKPGITKSVQYALKHMGIVINDLDLLERHIGPPLKEGFMEYYGFSAEEADRAVRKYREYYEKNGIFENRVYDGLEELLKKLKQAGKKTIVATSKPEDPARRILKHFKLEEYFHDICGATSDDARSSKEDVIRYALSANNIQDLSTVIMVGDRRYDIEGAEAVGIKSLGVLYGYGSREELERAGADLIAADMDELYSLLIQ